jgi:hypothetical protein
MLTILQAFSEAVRLSETHGYLKTFKGAVTGDDVSEGLTAVVCGAILQVAAAASLSTWPVGIPRRYRARFLHKGHSTGGTAENDPTKHHLREGRHGT